MRRFLPCIAALLVYAMTPSAGEITENLAHLVSEGHMAHAVQDDAHQPDDPEHGCSGPFHACSCHSSAPFTAARAAVEVGAPLPAESEVGWWWQDAPPEGHPEGVFRPPIA